MALTESGSTALWMSRHRVNMPIYALTPKVASQRRMALYRNVQTMLMDTHADRDSVLHQAESAAQGRWRACRAATSTPSPAASRWARRVAPTC